eukprot:11185782-Alexandrium_andersonii.AAC.1
MTVVLSAGPSSPGPDGLPYEAYQAGSTSVTALAAQAQYARAGVWSHPPAWGKLLGRSVDLLVWIPKAAGADTP